LKAWNIAADSVVFVDDSAMEVAEVKAAWPEMECLLFPGKDPASAENFLRTLRDLFGKSHLGAEDSLRLESLRRSAEFQTGAEGSAGAPEQFLAQAGATMTIEFNPPASEARVLELVNKTNQFISMDGGIRKWSGASNSSNPAVSLWRSPMKTSSDHWGKSLCCADAIRTTWST